MNNRILLVTAEYSTHNSGGAGVYAQELSSALSSSNLKIHVISAGTKHSVKKINSNLTIEYVPTVFLPILRTPIFWLNARRIIKKICKKEQIDLIHSNNTAAAFVDSNKPLITTVQHPVILENNNYFFLQRLLNNLDIIIEAILVKKSKRIIVTSPNTLEAIETIYPKLKDKVTLIPIGVDTNFFKPVQKSREKISKRHNINNGHKLFFMPGGMRAKRKGIETLIKAIENVTNPNFKCIITGRSRELGWQKYFNRLINESKYRSNIINVGEIEYKDLPLYYSAADLTVFPSLFEGFGLPIIESLSCGTPVLATKTGEAKEIVNKSNGFLVDINDADSIAKILSNLLSNTNDLSLMREYTRKSIIKKYSWKAVIKEYFNLYNEISS